MGNVRSLRKNGDKLILGGCTYTIKDVEGCGGNSVVYHAIYNDNLNKELQHEVLIKELYPYHPRGGIYRDENICRTAKYALNREMRSISGYYRHFLLRFREMLILMKHMAHIIRF